MIGVRQAVAAAREFAGALLEDEKLAGVSLEEVELSADDCYWMVTLGFPAEPSGRFSQFASPSTREYKVFKVDAKTGTVGSMKIRVAA